MCVSRRSYVSLSAMVACTCSLACAQAAGIHSGVDNTSVIYESPDRASFAEISHGVWFVGNRVPAKETAVQKSDSMFSEVIGEKVLECSDDEYRCISSWMKTYAIPLRRLSPADIYVKDGVTFRVEKCLRGDAGICQVALIGGYCLKALDDRCSLEAREDKPDRWLYVTYFFYNEDFGITAMGVTKSPAKTINDMILVANQLVLQGSRGLLFPTHRLR